MAAPQQQQQSAVHPDDVNDWVERAKNTLNKPDHITKPPTQAQGARPWTTDFFGCFDPIDTCLITCCCPCVTFGKTHHRLRKSPTLEGYSPVNASCVGFFVSTYFCGAHWILQAMQRADVREKNNLEGEFVPDCLKIVCCGCCDLIQQDKEAAYHALNGGVISQQPGMTKEAMSVNTMNQ